MLIQNVTAIVSSLVALIALSYAISRDSVSDVRKEEQRLKDIESAIEVLRNHGHDKVPAITGLIWDKNQKIVEYPNGAYEWDTKYAICPDDHYVSGIQVEYRGTCGDLCSKDGGAVGQIKLFCRKVALAR